ncbi:hypothetical protein HNR53_002005 [Bacillus benzoevorans]|uniref:Uncharacterized protein n=1 Tax=Bacillus benzoevorans TaxID=1456 RepID=A0A7X0HR24_9BACI|nr:hypothetical protein [Bacillus benzoevorans]
MKNLLLLPLNKAAAFIHIIIFNIMEKLLNFKRYI